MMIKTCPFCKSKNLSLKVRGKDNDLMSAKMVELHCDKCDRWIKWVSKKEREFYMGINIPPRTQTTKPKRLVIKEKTTTKQKDDLQIKPNRRIDYGTLINIEDLKFERDAALMANQKLKEDLKTANKKIKQLETKLAKLKGGVNDN